MEPHENALDAAHREAVEEAGALLNSVQYIGCYRISDRGEIRWADVFVAAVRDLVEIQCPAESRGRQLVTMEELPNVYHQWNPLLESVFEYSWEILLRQRELDQAM